MKRLLASIVLLLLLLPTWGQGLYRRPVRPTRNVIVMIPDGTSVDVLSAARWLRVYRGGEATLAVDPWLCGLVKTHSSNAPIGDSAPTTSCYMTGMPQRTGNVSVYPAADPGNDLCPVDPSQAYRPLATLLEAARVVQDKAVGLVATCEFPHATPADCAAHHYDRGRYEDIAPQMAAQNLDLLFAGGTDFVTDDMRRHFAAHDTRYIADDLDAFRRLDSGRVWALFEPGAFPYDLDRDTTRLPSLEEMTRKALSLLSQHENGFFLMVEGSLVDWAAHANDPAAIMTEYLAFDAAVGAALDFARRDGNTTVLVLPDHGNSGFSIGRYGLRYDTATLSQLFGAVAGYRATSYGLAAKLRDAAPGDMRRIVSEYTGLQLTDDEYAELLRAKDAQTDDYMKAAEKRSLQSVVKDVMNSRTHFGFTGGGHTGEDVFLAAYHPQGDVPLGLNTNVEINRYLCDVMGLTEPLDTLTGRLFARHDEVFAGMKHEPETDREGRVELRVKCGRHTLRVPAFSSVAYLDGKPFDMGSVAVYIDRNHAFYLPKSLSEKMMAGQR